MKPRRPHRMLESETVVARINAMALATAANANRIRDIRFEVLP